MQIEWIAMMGQREGTQDKLFYPSSSTTMSRASTGFAASTRFST
jgi:hypothetical protein